jgi:ComF family protein
MNFIQSVVTNKLFEPFKKQLQKPNFDAIINWYQQGLLHLSRCDLCAMPCQNYLQLCDHCYQDLPLFNQNLVHGDLLNWPNVYQHLPNVCFDQLIALSPHQHPFTHWLGQFKYQGRFELATLFGHLLAECFIKLIEKKYLVKPDLVISVPLHLSRWQDRGFNQAHLIAEQFQQKVKAKQPIDYASNLLERSKKTARQVGQTGGQRRKNLQGAFVLKTTAKLPANIMLIDDVITTGTTASEITQLLKKHGAQRVTVMAVTLALAKQ